MTTLIIQCAFWNTYSGQMHFDSLFMLARIRQMAE